MVVCTRCGFGKITERGTSTTKCAHCGRGIDVGKAVVRYEGDSPDAARAALFIINAGMNPAAERESRPGAAAAPSRGGVSRKGLESFLEENDCFTVQSFADYMEIKAADAEERIARLVEAGVLYSPSRGRYCVVR